MKTILLAALACWVLAGAVAASPPLEVYGRHPDVDLMRLSPSGERYAFIAVSGETRKIVVGTLQGKILVADSIGTAKVRNIRWADDDHLTITVTATVDPFNDFRSFELASVTTVNLLARKSRWVFADHRFIAQTVVGEFGFARVDGALSGYFGGITLDRGTGSLLSSVLSHTYPDLYRVDLDTLDTRIEAKGDETRHYWLVGPNGVVEAHSEYDEKSGRWRLFRGANRGKLLLEKVVPLSDIALAGFGRAEGTVLVRHEVDGRDTVEELSLEDGRRKELFASADVQDLIHHPASGLLIGAFLRNPARTTFFDPTIQARFDGTRKFLSKVSLRLESLSRDLNRMIIRSEGEQDSGTYWLIDFTRSPAHADQIGQAYPEVAPADVGATKRFQYLAADGLAIEGVLTLPPVRKAERLPLVVMPHGGPLGIRDDIRFDWWAQAYASRGYAVLQPNYRGSSGHGRAFQNAGFGQWGRKMLTDISDGVAALAAQRTVDPKRVCIVGASYGGYTALAGVTMQHGIYRCAVSVAGPADLPAFFDWQSSRRGDESSATRFWRALTGADKEGSDAMTVISPTRFAAQADGPILLIHGKDDTVVPIGQSERMADALKDSKKSVEFVVMDGEDHWLSRAKTRTTMLKAAVEFVQKYNPPD